MVVRENISFERGIGSKKSLEVGADSQYVKERRVRDLFSKMDYISDEEKEKIIPKLINDIDRFEKALDILKSSAGLDPKEVKLGVRFTGDIIFSFKSWQVARGNTVIVQALSESDANELMKAIKKRDAGLYSLTVYRSNSSMFMTVYELEIFFKNRGWS